MYLQFAVTPIEFTLKAKAAANLNSRGGQFGYYKAQILYAVSAGYLPGDANEMPLPLREWHRK
jgi:hypothetical protein